jgi:predicted transposase YbfD/YdcC
MPLSDIPIPALLPSAFHALNDPRTGNATRHPFFEVLFISLCAMLAGADGFEEIARWAECNQTWLEKHLTLPNGLPSPDTYRRIFAALCPAAFGEGFLLWTREIASTQHEIIAIDGKTLRASEDSLNEIAPLHLVSAWATKNRLVLAQQGVEHKENEIVAIPRLLEMLDLKDSIVTMDAMGCQKEIAKQIVEAEGDYLLALKGNHGILHERVVDFFDSERARGWKTFYGDEIAHSYCQSLDKGHGRLEIRRCWVVDQAHWLDVPDAKGEVFGFGSVVCIESERHVRDRVSVESRYFLSSLGGDASVALRAGRHHWGIENRLHWVLDVCFSEDRCRVRDERARYNLALLRQVSVNLLNREKSAKGGVAGKRKRAAWNVDYLLKILTTPERPTLPTRS